jgi:hypothetical protein
MGWEIISVDNYTLGVTLVNVKINLLKLPPVVESFSEGPEKMGGFMLTTVTI